MKDTLKLNLLSIPERSSSVLSTSQYTTLEERLQNIAGEESRRKEQATIELRQRISETLEESLKIDEEALTGLQQITKN